VVPISLQDARTTGPAVKVFEGWHKTKGAFNKIASWSPDGSKLAVIHKGDVWIASTNGDKPVQLTNTTEPERYPSWSLDGKTVYYVVLTKDNQDAPYMVAASGGKATKTTGGSWSPDGKKRAVISNGLISIVNVTEGHTQHIADLKDLGLAKDCRLRWSPDSKYIACIGYHIEKGQSGPIFIIPVEGSKITEVGSNDQGSKILIYWSPDGKWISYHSDGTFKTRPEGTMWEADFDEILTKVMR
jgi:Tol biopolymer transport system component